MGMSFTAPFCMEQWYCHPRETMVTSYLGPPLFPLGDNIIVPCKRCSKWLIPTVIWVQNITQCLVFRGFSHNYLNYFFIVHTKRCEQWKKWQFVDFPTILIFSHAFFIVFRGVNIEKTRGIFFSIDFV